MRNSEPVLLVEDDNIDAMTVERAFKDLSITNPLVRKANGQEALEYLRSESNGKVCLVLTDLNMPQMGGMEFLKAIKAEDQLKKIPVVILSTSQQDRDKIESFNLGIAGYIVKPVDYKKFVETIRVIKLYWTLSELPERG